MERAADGPLDGPTLAERARTALAGASVASLVTTGCPARPRTLTVVGVEDQADGRPLVLLDAASATVRELAVRPVATVTVPGPEPFRSLALTGPLRPFRPSSTPGRVSYRLSPLSVRLSGARSIPLPLTEFHAASPDPLGSLAPRVLEHLGTAHAAELLACVRCHGHRDAQAVVPRALDRYGIELAVLGPAGVESVRLPFPGGPVRSAAEVPVGLRVALTCPCRHAQES